MKISPLLCFIVAGLGAVSKGSGAVDEATISSLAMGKGYAATLSLTELSDDYHAVRLKIGSEGGGLLDGYLNQAIMFGMSGQTGQPNPFDVITLTEDSWTKGETVRASNQEFLITYRLTVLPARGAVKAPSLKLTLLRTDSITSIAPDASLTPKILQEKLLAIAQGRGMRFGLDRPLEGDTVSTSPSAWTFEGPMSAQDADKTIQGWQDAKVRALQASAQSNAKLIALALEIYTTENDDLFPYAQDTATVQRVADRYIKSSAPWKTQNPAGSTWRFNMKLSGVLESAVDHPAKTPMLWESKAWADGSRIVAFADGHAKRIPAADWPKIQAALKWSFSRKAKHPLPSG